MDAVFHALGHGKIRATKPPGGCNEVWFSFVALFLFCFLFFGGVLCLLYTKNVKRNEKLGRMALLLPSKDAFEHRHEIKSPQGSCKTYFLFLHLSFYGRGSAPTGFGGVVFDSYSNS